MSVPFSRTLRALESEDTSAWAATLFCAAAFMLVVLGWLFFASVDVYETTDQARIEAISAGHVVQSPLLGQVAGTHLELGRVVQAGDVLVELDSRAQRLALDAEQARHAARAREIDALKEQIRVNQETLLDVRTTAAAAEAEARSRAAATLPAAEYSQAEMGRLQMLRETGMIAEMEYLRRRSEAEQQRLAVQSATLSVSRVTAEMQVLRRDRLSGIERIRHDLTLAQNAVAISAAEISRLQFEVDRRRIVAPIAGKIGSLTPLSPGSFVDEGAVLASVVPADEMHVVAEFRADRSLGRIHPGQRARIRLDAFPWAQYGALQGTVSHVATEGRQGLTRVELVVDGAGAARHELQHALSASVDLQLESVAPIVLLLRAAGRMATRRAVQPTPVS